MTDEELLAELEDLLRTIPSRQVLGGDSPESLSWLGRAIAIVTKWRPGMAVSAQTHLTNIISTTAWEFDAGYKGLLLLLNQARADLRLKTVGPLSMSVQSSMVFDYFDEIRKILEEAESDLLFVDPYLNPEFVSRYLPHISDGVQIRLLARERIDALVAAAKMYAIQHKMNVEIRVAQGFHDRYVFIDNRACYQSGTSFKDGPKNAPTTITQITDAFNAVYQTYQTMWHVSTVKL